MKAISLIPGTTQIELIEQIEPQIQHSDEVKLKVMEVGVCGTDRELAAGGRASAPQGEEKLIIGHEMIGNVIEVGKSVKEFKPGDLAIVTVRRGCNHCPACLADRADMCYSGDYLERGIKGSHGFNAEFVIDKEKHLIKVHKSAASYGVLCEPASIVEKAIDEIVTLQKTRLPDWAKPEDIKKKRALVVGLGPIGLLACILLKLRGFQLFASGIIDATSNRAKLVEEIGGTYIDSRKVQYKEMPSRFGSFDLIYEAAGLAQLDFQLLFALGNNGGCVLTGVADQTSIFSVEGGYLMHQLVLKNQMIFGSVNAATKHWKAAIEDLEKAENKWPGVVSKLITTRLPKERFKELLGKKSENEIKGVLVWK